MMPEQMPLVERYLSQFRAGLKRLSEAERNEIVDEIRSHIAEAMAAGVSLAVVLERLGPADCLSRAYLALGPGQPALTRWLKAASILAGFGLSSLLILPVLGTFGIVFPIASVWGLLANIIQFLFPSVGYIGGTKLASVAPLPTLAIGVAVNVLLFIVGIGSFKLLKAYIRISIKTIRESWS